MSNLLQMKEKRVLINDLKVFQRKWFGKKEWQKTSEIRWILWRHQDIENSVWYQILMPILVKLNVLLSCSFTCLHCITATGPAHPLACNRSEQQTIKCIFIVWVILICLLFIPFSLSLLWIDCFVLFLCTTGHVF